MVNLNPLIEAAVGIGATALSIFGSIALNALRKRYSAQLSESQATAYQGALDKGLQYAVTQITGEIEKKGWGHIDVRNHAVDIGFNYVLAREPEALAGVGLSPKFDDPNTRLVLTQALTRTLPTAFTLAAASPATPAAPPSSAPVVVAEVMGGVGRRPGTGG